MPGMAMEADLRKLFGKYATADRIDKAAVYKFVHDCELLDNNVTLAYIHKVLTRISAEAVAFSFEQFQDMLEDIVGHRPPSKRGGAAADPWRQLMQDVLRLATAQPKAPAVSNCLQPAVVAIAYKYDDFLRRMFFASASESRGSIDCHMELADFLGLSKRLDLYASVKLQEKEIHVAFAELSSRLPTAAAAKSRAETIDFSQFIEALMRLSFELFMELPRDISGVERQVYQFEHLIGAMKAASQRQTETRPSADELSKMPLSEIAFDELGWCTRSRAYTHLRKRVRQAVPRPLQSAPN
jgi:hypothetical protein